MSSANAAAKKRRAGVIDTAPPSPPQQNIPNNGQNQQPASGLTIYQVVALFDKRLIVLEKTVADFIKTYTEEIGDEDVESHEASGASIKEAIEVATQAASEASKEMIDEFGARFEILAEEIDSLKNTVMTLQTYTMSVNKMLLESNGKFRNIPNIAMNK